MTNLVLYRGPTLLDYIQVCRAVLRDETGQVDQYEAFAGKPYDPDEVAALCSLRVGPAWVLVLEDGERRDPIGIAGFDQIRPGVWQDFMFTDPRAWDPYWRTTTKLTRRAMDAMLRTEAHRLQCVSLASRIHAHKWYRILGLRLEGTLSAYGANGEDALMFARVRDS